MSSVTRPKTVSASILSADFANLERDIRAVLSAGADWIHVDVMDGHFVPNLTIGAPVVRALRKVTTAALDVHLMITEPERFVDDFADAGSDWLTIHVEATQNPGDVLRRIRARGMKAGLSLRPQTSLDAIMPLLDRVDLILVMTVNPGFGGQKFMHDQVAKIQALRRHFQGKDSAPLIEVDGGVNDETIRFLQEADVLVAGNYIFKNDYQNAIRTLKG